MAKSASTTVLVVVLIVIAIVIASVIGLFILVRFLEVRRKMRQDARVEAAKSVGNTKRNHRRRFSQTEYDLPRSDTKRFRRFSTDGGSQEDRWGHLLDDVDDLADDKERPLSSLENLQIESGPVTDSVAIDIFPSRSSTPIPTPTPTPPPDPTPTSTPTPSPSPTPSPIPIPIPTPSRNPSVSPRSTNRPISNSIPSPVVNLNRVTHIATNTSMPIETEAYRRRFIPEEDLMIVTPTDTIMQIVHAPVVVEREFPWSHPISVSGCTEDMTEEA